MISHLTCSSLIYSLPYTSTMSTRLVYMRMYCIVKEKGLLGSKFVLSADVDTFIFQVYSV
jgi:hypothetical protein